MVRLQSGHTWARANLGLLPKLGVFVTGCGVAKLYICSANISYCDASRSRLAGYKTSNTKAINFDFKLFWQYLKPHLWRLIAAMLVRLTHINVQFGLVLSFRVH